MGTVLAQLIPVAAAAALSTVPITAMIFILLSERRSATALPFLSGWVIGTAAGLTLATLAGLLLQRTSFGWPLLCAGGLKLTYDFLLLALFHRAEQQLHLDG